MAFQSNAFQSSGFQIARFGGVPPIVELAPNGNGRREYQPTYYELKAQRDFERKIENAALDLKATEIKIEELELKRLRDLADRQMQTELLALLAMQNELQQRIQALEQQRLRLLQDDDDFVALLMSLPI